MHVMKHSRVGLHMHLVQQQYRIADQRCIQIMQMYVPTSYHYFIHFFLSKPPEDALHCSGQARVKKTTEPRLAGTATLACISENLKIRLASWKT